MDTPKLENKPYKKIVPIKGNLLQKLKNKIRTQALDDKIVSNNVNNKTNNIPQLSPVEKHPLKSPDNKIIIQKVENVKIDVSSYFVTYQTGEEGDLITKQVDPVSQKNDETQQDAKGQSALENLTPSTTVKLLTTRIPSNPYNESIPLKLVRTIKQPKPKPNICQRYHRVETFKSDPIQVENKKPIVAKDKTQTQRDGKVIVPVISRPKACKVKVSDSEEDFKGFEKSDQIDITKDLGRFHQLLQSKNVSVEPTEDEQRAEQISSPLKLESPKKMQISSPIKPIAMETWDIQPEPAPIPVELEAEPAPEPSKPDSFDWQEDIFVVIGDTRLQAIDKMLKVIPDCVTGNEIELENFELKLIIKHLLKKLKLDSIMATLDKNDNQNSLDDESSNNDDDDDDDDDNSNGSFQYDSNMPDSCEPDTDDTSGEGDPQPGPSRCAEQAREVAATVLMNSMEFDKDFIQLTNDLEQTLEMPPVIDELEGELEQQVIVEQSLVIEEPFLDVEMCGDEKIPKFEIKSPEACVKVESSSPVLRKRKMEKSPPVECSKKQKTSRVLIFENGLDRRMSLRSSSCDSEPVASPKSKTSQKENLAQKSSTSSSPVRRVSPRRSTISSSDDSKPLKKIVNKKVSRVDELRSSESDSGPRRRSTRSRRIVSSSDCSTEPMALKNLKNESEESDDEPRQKQIRKSRSTRVKALKVNKVSNKKEATPSKIFDSDSDMPSNASRNNELKSRLHSPDFNSNRKSMIVYRNDYLKSPDKRKKVKNVELSQMADKLASSINETKTNDPTYIEPTVVMKRERLRTSAFKGNEEEEDEECSNDEDIQDHSKSNTRAPSVSRMSSDEEDDGFESPPRIRRLRLPELSHVQKKTFVQEKLEAANDKRVPYEQILEALRTSVSARKAGVISKDALLKIKEKKAENLKLLQALKYFRCGSCQFNVTKHKWIEHFMLHGGFAWIDEFEPPMDICDWNELVRRAINNFKIYNVTVMKCPNCDLEKKSALGHMSHFIVCGVSKDELEQRMATCTMCNLKFLPFNASSHRNKCSKGVKQLFLAEQVNADEKSDSDKDPENFTTSGRMKRKAVQKAEKKFKILLKASDKPTDYLNTEKGKLKCEICGASSFKSKEDAIEHIKNDHSATVVEEDFSGSESDADIKEDESSETEGSSGVDSSDLDSSEGENEDLDNEDADADDANVSSKKAKLPSWEPIEVKAGRIIVQEYVEELRSQPFPKKVFGWTKEFVDANWKVEVLPEILPKFIMNRNQSAKIALALLNYNQHSLKFGSKAIGKYNPAYQVPYNGEWNQLEIGENLGDDLSETIYCGGSVSSVDWAPSSGDLNFLAVACNNEHQGVCLNRTVTSKSCIQIYEMSKLTNEKFPGFKGSSKLCYAIIVNDGPISSIKFHPSECSIEKRIGLLAVTTANQSVFIYSLPYLNKVKSIILPLEPHLICKLEDDHVLFVEQYLLQATKVCWYQKNDSDCILAAGFISGTVAIWNVSRYENKENKALLPLHVIQAHLEPVTGLDFKASTDSEFHLLTAALDRKIRVYTFDEAGYQEVSNSQTASRVLCCEWMMNWPGYISGFDDCFTVAGFNYRIALEFGMRNSVLLNLNASIINLSINHWMNFVVFVTDSGDIFGCNPNQMLQHHPKEKWQYFNFTVLGSTDYNKITTEGNEEIGVVFGDFKTKTTQPKKYRLSPTDKLNELQINQVSFNRNEKSHRFFALGYETGFVRIRYLKNLK